MPNPLYNIPGLGGYVGQDELNRQRESDELSRVGKFQTLQEHMRATALDQAYRAELNQLPENQRTLENLSRLGAKYAPPKDVFHYATTAATSRETALARLQQAAEAARMRYGMWYKSETRKDKKDAIQALLNAFNANLRAGGQQYNIGGELQHFDIPLSADFGEAAPTASPRPTAGGTQWTEPTQQQVPPQDRAAYDAVLANAKAGIPSSELGVGGGPEPQPPGGPSPEPQSMDENQREMYLLQQRGAQQPPTAPAEATPAATPEQPQPTSLPPMPPEVARLPPKLRDDWTKRMALANSMGLQNLSGEEKKFWIDRVLGGGDMPTFGWGQQGMASRLQFMKEVAAEGQRKGITGADSLANRAYLRANQGAMTSLARLGAQVLSFEGTALRNLEVAIGEAERYVRVGVPIIDKFGNPIRKALGDTDITALRAALITVRNEYTKISASATAAGVAGTLHDRQEIGTLLGDEMNIGQLKRVAEVMRKDMGNRRISIEEEQLKMRQEIAKVPGPTPTATPAPGRRAEGQRGTSKSGKPMIIRNGQWEYE